MRWYAVHLHPRAEAHAARHLAKQGFQPYCPRLRKRRRHARREDFVEVPLFPGYLFVRMDLSAQRWRAVNSTVGVCRLISSGEVPLPVSDMVVDAIRAREDSQGYVELSSSPGFRPGERIDIAEGPFSDLEAVFLMPDGPDRVLVLLDLLGRTVPVHIPAASVRALA